jgi:hypothetical protein
MSHNKNGIQSENRPLTEEIRDISTLSMRTMGLVEMIEDMVLQTLTNAEAAVLDQIFVNVKDLTDKLDFFARKI